MKIKNRAIVLLTTMAVVLVVGSGVALAATVTCTANSSCLGTLNPDTMNGSSGLDEMYAFAGADTMHGNGEDDSMEGGKGSDHIYGDAGNDSSLWGGELTATNTYADTSDDYVHGGNGTDTIYGGFAQGGVDRLYGEGADDFIDASARRNSMSPVTKEIIDCGAGANDVVYFDKGVDVVTNCEAKHGVS